MLRSDICLMQLQGTSLDASRRVFSWSRRLHSNLLPHAQYGKFCKGDSYLVLKTTQTKGGSYEWDLHFWLGAESSVDEVLCFHCLVYGAIVCVCKVVPTLVCNVVHTLVYVHTSMFI